LRWWQIIGLVALALVALRLGAGMLVQGDSSKLTEATADSPVPSSAPDFGLPPPNAALPKLGWAARGVVIKEPVRRSSAPVGTVLNRPWSFHRECNLKCRIIFLRFTLYGPSVTSLVRSGEVYIAKFPPVRVHCYYLRGSRYPRERHYFGASHDSYTLWWSPDGSRITAIERQYETGCYPPPRPVDITRWHAVRDPGAAGSAARGGQS
jgi:hypothetical protein